MHESTLAELLDRVVSSANTLDTGQLLEKYITSGRVWVQHSVTQTGSHVAFAQNIIEEQQVFMDSADEASKQGTSSQS